MTKRKVLKLKKELTIKRSEKKRSITNNIYK